MRAFCLCLLGFVAACNGGGLPIHPPSQMDGSVHADLGEPPDLFPSHQPDLAAIPSDLSTSTAHDLQPTTDLATTTDLLAVSDLTVVHDLAATPDLAAPTVEATIQAMPTVVVADGASVCTIVVTVTDSAGNPLPGRSVFVSASGEGNALTQSPPTDANGQATVLLRSIRAQIKTISATVGGLTASPHPTVTFIAGPAAKLAFRVQPSNATRNANIRPAVQVILTDAHDNPTTDDGVAVTLQLGTHPAGAVLTGGASQSTSQGIATFAGLSIDTLGDYTLVADSNGLVSAESNAFAITLPWSEANAGLDGQLRGSIGQDPADPAHLFLITNRLFETHDAGQSWSLKPTPFVADWDSPLVMADSQTLYVRASGRIYRTVDGANTWSLSLDQSVKALDVSVSNPSIAYAIDNSRRLFRSPDAGASWTTRSLLTSDLASLAVDPQHDNVVYVGTTDGHLLKSVDSGGTWSAFDAGLPGSSASYPDVRAIAIDPTDSTHLMVAASLGVYRRDSTTGGFIGVPLTYSTWYMTIEFAPTDPHRVVVSYTGSSVFVSSDGGKTFVERSKNANVLWYPRIGVSDPDEIWAVGDQVSHTVDAGLTWEERISGLHGAQVWQLAPDPTTKGVVYMAARNCGMYATADGGASWHPLNSGLATSWREFDALTVAIDPFNPMQLATGGYDGVFTSIDRGASWTEKAGPDVHNGLYISATLMGFDPGHSGRLLAFGNNEYITNDYGASWSAGSAYHGIGWPGRPVFDPSDPSTVYVGANDGLWKSIDGGIHWTALPTGAPSFKDTTSAVAIDPVTTTVVYRGNRNCEIWKSTDAGTTWTMPAAPLGNCDVHDFVFDPAGTLYAATSAGVFKSTNGGMTWQSRSVGLPAIDLLTIAIDPFDSQTLWVGTIGAGVWKTTSGGE